ncbi:MAG TPA: methylated-DNA--[protein]-cysteine S-methyltransferase [Candidatus Limnocylindria bacterium]|nr:methylated-DNA--[protein]-cysteine S-methyltransferase [Candidatus Limnocylindria bacterium]
MKDLEGRLHAAAPPAAVPPDASLEAWRRRAAAEGLLDVAYAAMDSPLGPLTVFVTPAGLLRLSYPDDPIERQLTDVATRISPRVVRAPERTDAVRRQLDDYFERRRRRFEVAIDWRLVRGFAADVLRATARVPYGRVTNYRDVAAAAGSPRGARAAGNALGSNPIPIVVPCHRVVHADGGLGGYTGGLPRKEFLLALEGAR